MLSKIVQVKNETHTDLTNQTSLVDSRFHIDLADNSLALWLARAFLVYLLLFIFIGIVKVLEPLMDSAKQIINQKTTSKWNKTAANFTLIAFSLNAFEVFYPSIELLTSGFQSYTTGPLLIIVTQGNTLF